MEEEQKQEQQQEKQQEQQQPETAETPETPETPDPQQTQPENNGNTQSTETVTQGTDKEEETIENEMEELKVNPEEDGEDKDEDTADAAEEEQENDQTVQIEENPTKKVEDTTWEGHVLPHGPLIELVQGKLWLVEGTLNKGKVKRNMIVYKLESGLWCHSVVALNEETLQKMKEIGEPQVFVVASLQEITDALVWQNKFPSCKLICPAEFVEGIKKKGLNPYGTCEDVCENECDIKIHVPSGIKRAGFGIGGELMYELKLGNSDIALVIGEMLSNNPSTAGLRKFVTTTTGALECPKLVQWAAVQNKVEYRSWLEQLADSLNEKLKIITVSHGPPITENPMKEMKEAASRL